MLVISHHAHQPCRTDRCRGVALEARPPACNAVLTRREMGRAMEQQWASASVGKELQICTWPKSVSYGGWCVVRVAEDNVRTRTDLAHTLVAWQDSEWDMYLALT
jgi:hypothetical protein